MVFAGFFPVDSKDYGDLKDALEKLRLNDAAFEFEPETSQALGFGFRCGFLGLLHMEIVQERLEREYQMDLITTAPTVIHHVYCNDGVILKIDNPAHLPTVQDISHIEEPMLKANIHLPTEYVGTVMKLCEDRRGNQINLTYPAQNRECLLGCGRAGISNDCPNTQKPRVHHLKILVHDWFGVFLVSWHAVAADRNRYNVNRFIATTGGL